MRLTSLASIVVLLSGSIALADMRPPKEDAGRMKATAGKAFNSAAVVAQGLVQSITTVEVSDGLVTEIAFKVQKAWKGASPGQVLYIRQLGGWLDKSRVTPSRVEWLNGSPRYQVGATALVYLHKSADGYLTTSGFSDGYIPRKLLSAPGALDSLQHQMVDILKSKELLPSSRSFRQSPSLLSSRTVSAKQSQLVFAYMGDPPPKWLIDRPVRIIGDSAGDAKLGLAAAQNAARVTAQGWNAASRDLRVQYVGDEPGPGWGCFEQGTTRITFNDPLDQIAPPNGCTSGALAVGGFCASDGVITAAAILYNDEWGDCWFWTVPGLAEICGHEFGHCVAGAHSWEVSNGPPEDQRYHDALMAPYAHFDGRGESPQTLLKDYDLGLAESLYGPVEGPQPSPAPSQSPRPSVSQTPRPTNSPRVTQTPRPTPTPTVKPQPGTIRAIDALVRFPRTVKERLSVRLVYDGPKSLFPLTNDMELTVEYFGRTAKHTLSDRGPDIQVSRTQGRTILSITQDRQGIMPEMPNANSSATVSLSNGSKKLFSGLGCRQQSGAMVCREEW